MDAQKRKDLKRTLKTLIGRRDLAVDDKVDEVMMLCDQVVNFKPKVRRLYDEQWDEIDRLAPMARRAERSCLNSCCTYPMHLCLCGSSLCCLSGLAVLFVLFILYCVGRLIAWYSVPVVVV